MGCCWVIKQLKELGSLPGSVRECSYIVMGQILSNDREKVAFSCMAFWIWLAHRKFQGVPQGFDLVISSKYILERIFSASE